MSSYAPKMRRVRCARDWTQSYEPTDAILGVFLAPVRACQVLHRSEEPS